MRFVLVAVLVAASACSGRWSMRVRDKAAPNRVERKATRSAPHTVVLARQVEPGRIEIKVVQRVSVTVDSTVHYAARETRVEAGHWLWELAELPLGLFMLWTIGIEFELIPPGRTRHVEHRHRSLATTFLDPTTRAVKMVNRTNIIAAGDHFADEPIRSYVNVRLPVEGAAVRYRVLDDARAVISAGAGTTDMFGAVEFEVGEAGARAVAVEVTTQDVTSIVAIRGEHP